MCKVTKRKVLLTRPPGLSQILTRIIFGDGLPGFPCAAVWNETSQIGHTTTYTWSSWDAQGCPCLCTKPPPGPIPSQQVRWCQTPNKSNLPSTIHHPTPESDTRTPPTLLFPPDTPSPSLQEPPAASCALASNPPLLASASKRCG